MAKNIRVIKANIDFTKKTIFITKEDQKRASVIDSAAYKEMCQMLKDYPGFSVAIKVRETKKDKKTYKNLSYKAMETYLQTAFSDDEQKKKMEEYRLIRTRAAVAASPFAFVRKWFLEVYKEYDQLNAAAKGEIA